MCITQRLSWGENVSSSKCKTGVYTFAVTLSLRSAALNNVALNRAFKEPLTIQWGLLSRLEDLDYADDLCVFTHSHSDMYQKLLRLQEEANKVGLQINVKISHQDLFLLRAMKELMKFSIWKV